MCHGMMGSAEKTHWSGCALAQKDVLHKKTKLLIRKLCCGVEKPDTVMKRQLIIAGQALATVHNTFLEEVGDCTEVSSEQWKQIMRDHAEDKALDWGLLQKTYAPADQRYGTIEWAATLEEANIALLLTHDGVGSLLEHQVEDLALFQLNSAYKESLKVLAQCEKALEGWKAEWHAMAQEQRLQIKRLDEQRLTIVHPQGVSSEAFTPRTRQAQERARNKLEAPMSPEKKKSLMVSEIRQQQENLSAYGGVVASHEVEPCSEEAARESFRKMIERSFARFDLDSSGSINSPEELLQLTTNLVWQLDLRFHPEEIAAQIREVGPVDAVHGWDQDMFESWFRANIQQPASEARVAHEMEIEAQRYALGCDSPISPASPSPLSSSVASPPPGAEGHDPMPSDFEIHLERLFRRYDLDDSGTINTSQEFYQLTTNLCWALDLKVTKEALQVKMNEIGMIGNRNAKSKDEFRQWFMAEFNEYLQFSGAIPLS